MTGRILATLCLIAALGAIIYIGATGERWPLTFAAIMVGGGMVIGVGEAALSRDEHDELQRKRYGDRDGDR